MIFEKISELKEGPRDVYNPGKELQQSKGIENVKALGRTWNLLFWNSIIYKNQTYPLIKKVKSQRRTVREKRNKKTTK